MNAPDSAVFLANLELFHVRFPAPVRAPGNLAAGDAYPMPRDHRLVTHFTFGHVFPPSVPWLSITEDRLVTVFLAGRFLAGQMSLIGSLF